MNKIFLLISVTCSLVLGFECFGTPFPKIIHHGYFRTDHFDSSSKPHKKLSIEEFCEKLAAKFKQYRWDKDPCGKVPWQVQGYTQRGRPLLYWVFGSGPKTTLLISGVHPDEMTPIPMGFRFANYILTNPKAVNPKEDRVIVAPLANPDGFLVSRPSRLNGSQIDINRNFPTLDWHAKAIRWWITTKGRNPRHFPGFFPESEKETYLQTYLISTYSPDKILSIHAPLGFLDYDGPGDRIKRPRNHEARLAKGYASEISKTSKNYRIVDYSFYPGSLGNYAGNERNIPTVTLELRTSKPEKVDEYWKLFLPGMLKSIEYPFRRMGRNFEGKAPVATKRNLNKK